MTKEISIRIQMTVEDDAGAPITTEEAIALNEIVKKALDPGQHGDFESSVDISKKFEVDFSKVDESGDYRGNSRTERVSSTIGKGTPRTFF